VNVFLNGYFKLTIRAGAIFERICIAVTTPRKPPFGRLALIRTPQRIKLIELATEDAIHRRKSWPEIAFEAGIPVKVESRIQP